MTQKATTGQSPSKQQNHPLPHGDVSSHPSSFVVSLRVSKREPWLFIEKVVRCFGFKRSSWICLIPTAISMTCFTSTPNGFTKIQGWHYPALDSTGWRAESSTRLPLLQMLVTSARIPQATHTSEWLGCKFESSHDSPQFWQFARIPLRTWGSTRLIHTGPVLKGSWIQSFHALSPGSLDISPSQHVSLFTNQKAPLSLGIQSFYWGLY